MPMQTTFHPHVTHRFPSTPQSFHHTHTYWLDNCFYLFLEIVAASRTDRYEVYAWSYQLSRVHLSLLSANVRRCPPSSRLRCHVLIQEMKLYFPSCSFYISLCACCTSFYSCAGTIQPRLSVPTGLALGYQFVPLIRSLDNSYRFFKKCCLNFRFARSAERSIS